MYFAKPKKRVKILDEPPKKEEVAETQIDAAEYSSEEEEVKPARIIPKRMPVAMASALHSRGEGQLSEKVPNIEIDENAPRKLFPTNQPIVGDAELNKVVEWQREIAERRKTLRNHPMWIFANLVAGHLGYQSVEPLLEPETEWPAPPSRADSGGLEDARRKAAELFQNPLATGLLNFCPAFTAALQGAYTDVCEWLKGRNAENRNRKRTASEMISPPYRPHVSFGFNGIRDPSKPPKMEQMIEDEGQLRTQFARLVARGMMQTSNLARDGYHLQVDYERVMIERTMLLKSITGLIIESKNRSYK